MYNIYIHIYIYICIDVCVYVYVYKHICDIFGKLGMDTIEKD